MNAPNHLPVDSYAHPAYCSPHSCESTGTDLIHREVVDPLWPSLDRHNVLTIGRVRCDDFDDDDGAQRVWPSEVCVTVGGERTHLTAAEAIAKGEQLAAMGRQVLAAEGGDAA